MSSKKSSYVIVIVSPFCGQVKLHVYTVHIHVILDYNTYVYIYIYIQYDIYIYIIIYNIYIYIIYYNLCNIYICIYLYLVANCVASLSGSRSFLHLSKVQKHAQNMGPSCNIHGDAPNTVRICICCIRFPGNRPPIAADIRLLKNTQNQPQSSDCWLHGHLSWLYSHFCWLNHRQQKYHHSTSIGSFIMFYQFYESKLR